MALSWEQAILARMAWGKRYNATGRQRTVAGGAIPAYVPSEAFPATDTQRCAAGYRPSSADSRSEVTTCRTTPALPCSN